MARSPLQSFNLHDGWTFRAADDDIEEWLPVRVVPTQVHLDLMHNKVIEDPFVDFNELKCQWVAEKTWVYRRTLPHVSRSSASISTRYVLAFDGLDTFATATVNGIHILTSDNMWHMHRVDVTHLISQKHANVLEIVFKPALLEARQIKDAHPEHTWVGFNGDMSRLAARKAQYHWGWDWGPILMSCGPWREVRFESYLSRIAELSADYTVHPSLRSVGGTITASVDGRDGDVVQFVISINGVEILSLSAPVLQYTAQSAFEIDQVQLWFPHGYGEQPLYQIAARLIDGGAILHETAITTGFRKCELVQQTDKIGKSFFFRVNNIDIFCAGANWIPADSFTPRISTQRYRSWLQAVVDGNQIMVRNWAGGNWEHVDFYNICDELGILVWQDFMFGCGNYPTFPGMLKSIEIECVTQTRRLRHHPSLVVYAGNNEDYQVQEQFGLTYDYEDKDPKSWLKTNFPARYIYEKLLPDIVAKNAPHVYYHPGSPWGDGKLTSDPTVGDLHQWNVWHGTQQLYQVLDTLGGRFVSEFGLEAFPHLNTIKDFVSDPSQLFPQSRVIDFHNKAAGHERRIATYLVENLRVESYDLTKYIHLTQISQAEAVTFAYRGWRRQWGQDRKCGGALIWQLNDCWPTISWSIIDYYQRKKPSYYAMKRALAPVAVGIKRDHHDWTVVNAEPPTRLNFVCWVASCRTVDVKAKVEVRFVSISTGKDIKDKIVFKNVTVKANGTTDVMQGIVDNTSEEPHVLAARVWIDGCVASRDVDWPQPLKYLDLSNRGLSVSAPVTLGESTSCMSIRVERPTKGLVFEERDGVQISDSSLDLVPGDQQEVVVKGMQEGAPPLRWTYLGAP